MAEDASLEELLAELRSADRPRLVLRPEPLRRGPKRVALVAGSFDPMTVAHAALAEAAMERADLAVLLYSARTLPKEGPPLGPLLSEPERIAALDAFCRNRTRMVVGLCSHGLLADQVEAARDRFPPARLILVMGSDKLLQLLDHRWYGDRDAVLDVLFRESEVLFALRSGDEDAVQEVLAGLKDSPWRSRLTQLQVPPSLAAVSSRVVRERLRRGEDVGPLVPPEARSFLPRHA
jgi:nicotinate-nucleotide adenylyltransferase